MTVSFVLFTLSFLVLGYIAGYFLPNIGQFFVYLVEQIQKFYMVSLAWLKSANK